MNIDNIKVGGNTTMGNVVDTINTNFSRVNQAVESLNGAAFHNKGSYSTEDALKAAVPSPRAGDFASVGEYKYECQNGEWVNTNIKVTVNATDVSNEPGTSPDKAISQKYYTENAVESEDVYNLNEIL